MTEERQRKPRAALLDTQDAEAVAERQRRHDHDPEPARRPAAPETPTAMIRRAKASWGLIAAIITGAAGLFWAGYSAVSGMVDDAATTARAAEHEACEARGADQKAFLEREQERADRCEDRLDSCRSGARQRNGIEPIDEAGAGEE